MELEAAKMIGAGLAAIALAGAGVGIGIIFGSINLDKIMNKNPKVRISQKIWETQNSGFNCGIPSDSAPYTFEKNAIIESNKYKTNLICII